MLCSYRVPKTNQYSWPRLRSVFSNNQCTMPRMGAMPVPVAMNTASLRGSRSVNRPWGPWNFTLAPSSKSQSQFDRKPWSTRFRHRSKVAFARGGDAMEYARVCSLPSVLGCLMDTNCPGVKRNSSMPSTVSSRCLVCGDSRIDLVRRAVNVCRSTVVRSWVWVSMMCSYVDAASRKSAREDLSACHPERRVVRAADEPESRDPYSVPEHLHREHFLAAGAPPPISPAFPPFSVYHIQRDPQLLQCKNKLPTAQQGLVETSPLPRRTLSTCLSPCSRAGRSCSPMAGVMNRSSPRFPAGSPTSIRLLPFPSPGNPPANTEAWCTAMAPSPRR